MKNKKDLLFFIFLFILFLLYIFRAKYGIVSNDESLYLAIPYRIMTGDALLVDEWNLSQLSSIILLPLLKIYYCIFKTVDGLYLFFRYIFVSYNLFVAIVSSRILKRNVNNDLYIFIPLLYFCFIPYRIFSLSYNSMLLSFIYLIVIIILKNSISKNDYIVIGILLALSILCNPYIIVIYFLYVFLSVVFNGKNNLFSFRSLFYVSLGSFIIFVYFLIMIFNNNSISDILKNIPYILNDPTHNSSFISKLIEPLFGYLQTYKYYYILWICLAIPLISKKYRNFFVSINFAYSLVLTIFMTLFRSEGFGYAGIGVNSIMMNVAIVGLELIILKEVNNKKLVCIYLLGFIYSLLVYVASNQGLFVFSIGSTVMTIASFLMMIDYYKLKNKIVYFGMIIQIACEIIVVFNGSFFDDSIFNLNYVIERGSFKGIITTIDKKIKYENVLDDIFNYDYQNERVLFFKNLPYAYLETNSLVGSYSVWNETDSINSKMYENYYSLHPEMVPYIIYIEREMVDNSLSEYTNYASINNYSYELLQSGAMVLERKTLND